MGAGRSRSGSTNRGLLSAVPRYLAQQHLSQKTFRRHVNNLWLLGGEIIRSLNLTPSEKTVPLERLVFDAVQAGGPLLYHSNSAEELRSFESTCRRFERFLAT